MDLIRRGIIFLTIATAWLLNSGPAPAATLEIAGNGACDLVSVSRNGQDYLALSALGRTIGLETQLDVLLPGLHVGSQSDTVTFIAGKAYCLRGSRVSHLAESPRYEAGDLYLSAPVAATEFARLTGYPMTWQAAQHRLVVSNPNNILCRPPISAIAADTSAILIKRIIIDPGHGGNDPGAIGWGYNEKDINLALARKTLGYLRQMLPAVELRLTRGNDLFVGLGERTKYANDARGSLFVSIHCNSSTNKEARGFEVYVLSAESSDNESRVEALENDVIRFESAEARRQYTTGLGSILERLRLNEYQQSSVELAGEIKGSFLARFRGLEDRGVKSARFYVLRGALMPAVLIETAFISNREDATLLASERFQDDAAAAFAEGIATFKRRYEAACSK